MLLALLIAISLPIAGCGVTGYDTKTDVIVKMNNVTATVSTTTADSEKEVTDANILLTDEPIDSGELYDLLENIDPNIAIAFLNADCIRKTTLVYAIGQKKESMAAHKPELTVDAWAGLIDVLPDDFWTSLIEAAAKKTDTADPND